MTPLRALLPLALLAAVAASPSAGAAPSPFALEARTQGSPVPLVVGGWSGDGREALLELDLLAVSPSARTSFTATWTSTSAVAPRGFSTLSTASLVDEGPGGTQSHVTAAPALTDLLLERRVRLGAGRWGAWEGARQRSLNSLEQSETVGSEEADCLGADTPTRYAVQYRLRGTKGGTDLSGVRLQVALGGAGCG